MIQNKKKKFGKYFAPLRSLTNYSIFFFFFFFFFFFLVEIPKKLYYFAKNKLRWESIIGNRCALIVIVKIIIFFTTICQ
jgi:hypothetical protein